MSAKKFPVALKAFFVNLLIACIVILPFMIMDRGYFAMTHDYSAEEIPYQMLMNQAVRSGNLLWNWGIDLGGNVLETFSFYNLGSPFTWFLWLLPLRLVVKAMPLVIILKYAFAGFSSALYLKRHLTCEKAVIFASILYSFSGFQCVSVVFFHFQDMVSFFPFMLIGLEKLVEEKKPGMLALACFLNTLCNYIFFVSEVLFLILYYVVRYLIPEIKEKKIRVIPVLQCMLEGAMGMLMAGILLVPSLYATLQNSRATSHMMGEQFFSRSTMDWLVILKAILLPAENMSRQSCLKGADWMTNAAYLPMVGIMLVLIYVFQKKDWLSAMIKLAALCVLFPLFNNAFTLLSAGEEYRRWIYMFLLFMALASGRVIENPREFPEKRKGILATFLLYGFFLGMVVLVRWNQQGNLVLRKIVFLFLVLLVIAGIVASMVLLYVKENLRKRLYCIGAFAFAVITLAFVIYDYRDCTDNTNLDFKKLANSYGENTYSYLRETTEALSKEPFPYRYYFDEEIGYSYYNIAMTGDLPSINSFISTVHPSVTELYECLGMGRATWTSAENMGSRELLSARYIFSLKEKPEYSFLEQLTLENGMAMNCYENERALPLGFTYDSYITRSELMEWPAHVRARLMLSYLVVKDEDVNKVSSILSHGNPWNDRENWDQVSIEECVGQRKECSREFHVEDNRFASNLGCEKESYAFFSVPYDKYWKAYVNGQEKEVLNICGLMAVPTSAGENNIEFCYDYKMLRYGVIASVFGGIGFALYFGINRKANRKGQLS